MRESMGTTWVFSLVLAFIMIFAGFLTLIITYSDVATRKNDVVEIIQKYEGFTSISQPLVNNVLLGTGYTGTGRCPEDYFAAVTSEIGGSKPSTQISNYCVQRVESNGKTKYNIILFFKFNLPVLGDLFTFNITGQTGNIHISSNGDYLE